MVIQITPEDKIKFQSRKGQRTLKEKLNRNLQAAWDSAEEFCLNSGIGGLRYCADRSRHWFERTWWFLVVALSFSVCAYMITQLWLQRAKYPTTVVYDDKITTIRAVPFPAITLCPPVRLAADGFNLTDFIDRYKSHWPASLANVPFEEKRRLNAALQLCSQGLRETFASNEDSNKTDASIYEYISKISFSRSSIFKSCAWVGETFDCDEFNIFLTEGGPCFTFNMLNSHSIYSDITAPQIQTETINPSEGNWNLEGELLQIGLPVGSQTSILPSFPHYISRLDDIETLTLKLNFNFQNYHWNFECYRPTTTSYKVFIHRPDEIKKLFDRPLEIEIGKKTGIYISPHVITASKETRKYSPYLRRCFFTSERQLKYFKTYTKSNCEHECLVNFVEKECGCVKFAMPRESSTPICNIDQLACYTTAVQKHRERRSLSNKQRPDSNDECDCLSTCVDVSYEAEVSELQYVDGNVNVDSNTMSVSTLLTISFKDNEFLSLKREEMYTTTNIVSICGGLLSLFMGISLLSIAEIIYHCTIGFGCKLVKRKSKKLIKKPASYTY